MKKLFACFAIALIWSCTEKKEVQKEEQKEVEITKIPDQYSIKQMMDNEAISGGSFYRDNSKLLVPLFSQFRTRYVLQGQIYT